jgi:hypothetical protein
VFGDIRINVVVSAVVFLGAVLYLVLVRKPREVLPWPTTGGGGDGQAGPRPDGSGAPDSADAGAGPGR